ncbi:MAG: secondary thiamine-phosphate synthase enzyme YjbQ [Oscillospiraceae bacterium]|jgi:secondary thiamine-phosphate synthase enzyme
MNLYRHKISTGAREKMIDITDTVCADIRDSGVEQGIAVVYTPHTTAGITINENSDPDVRADFIYGYDKAFPVSDPAYLHAEGNSSAHIKSSAVGASSTVIIEGGKPILGIWQALYFCEFDGPRERTYLVKIIGG